MVLVLVFRINQSSGVPPYLQLAQQIRQALASGVMGMDHAVRTFHRLTGVPLAEVVHMASLTPARMLGREREVGSLAAGKRADIVLLTPELKVNKIYIGGREFNS